VGIQRSLLIVALINCIGGLVVAVWGTRVSRRLIAAGVIALLFSCYLGLTFSGKHPILQYSRPDHNNNYPETILSYKEDQTASVAVLESIQGRKLNIDGFNAAGTYHYEYMHLLAHLPVLLSPSQTPCW